MGLDVHLVIADPMFIDPKHDDYRLRPDSPAIKLGFVPMDTGKRGRKDDLHLSIGQLVKLESTARWSREKMYNYVING